MKDTTIECDGVGVNTVIASVRVSRTRVNSTRNLVMSPSILPSEICSGPSTSKAGIK